MTEREHEELKEVTITRLMVIETTLTTHIVQTDRGEGQCCLTEIFWEENVFELMTEWTEWIKKCKWLN